MVHNYLGAGTYMFPLNIGFIAAYAHKYFPDEVTTKLFKYPGNLLETIKKETPDIIGFSNYTWNADLNARLAQFVKSISKEIIVVFGGPNINYTEKGIKNFFDTHQAVDYYIPFQGETPFVNLLRKYRDSGLDTGKLKGQTFEGIYGYNRNSGGIAIGKTLERIKNPDEIPSPYLTGLLDEFFEYNLIPIIETNRGCPYQCTFCAQAISSFHAINYFSLERVKEELNYIAAHIKKTDLLTLVDSNFGIVPRDMEIAEYLSSLYKKTGYPRKINANMTKNQPKIYEIAKILNNANLIVSLQSLDEVVLKNVKRSNIKISVFRDIVKKVNEVNGISGTEVILGLPGETYNSHLETLRKLFDWDVAYIICYNGLILDGTEMALAKENGEFKCQEKYRLIDSSFGKYNGITSFEAEQGILATDSMSQDELLSFRPVHWLVQFLWNYRYYYELLKFIKASGVNPVDYILRVIAKADKGATGVQKIFSEFKAEARNEWFDTAEDLRDYYSRPENFESLKAGLFGKMNGKYIFKMLIEDKKGFEQHLYETAINYSFLLAEKQEAFQDIINFLSNAIIDFSVSWKEIVRDRFITIKYDILEWRNSRYKKSLEKLFIEKGIKLRFYLPDDRGKALQKLFEQYKHPNKNVTLRKMSEYMPIKDFFYDVEAVKI
jgi:radical SAM superfamily enzyme YgiQ (UPF0313 family)